MPLGPCPPPSPACPRIWCSCQQGDTMWVVRVGGDDWELRTWHCI